MPDSLNETYLLVSLFWSSVGIGYWVYGKRQSSMSAMLGGVAMIAAAYLVAGALLMSLVCIGIAVGVYGLIKRGDP